MQEAPKKTKVLGNFNKPPNSNNIIEKMSLKSMLALVFKVKVKMSLQNIAKMSDGVKSKLVIWLAAKPSTTPES